METTGKKSSIGLCWLVAEIFITTRQLLHLITNTNYKLLGDEILYFSMVGHLCAGYATITSVTEFQR